MYRVGLPSFGSPTKRVSTGQCSELCGKDHAYMPITVKVVSQRFREAWLKDVDEYAGSHYNQNISLELI